MVIIGGTFNEPEIYCVLAINAPNETEAEIVKEDLFYATSKYGQNRQRYSYFCNIYKSIVGNSKIRIYESDDFIYRKGQKDTGERAVLPSNFQNYGYTSKFNNRNGNSGKAEQRISDEKLRQDIYFYFNDISLLRYDIQLNCMIYLRCKYDIISVH